VAKPKARPATPAAGDEAASAPAAVGGGTTVQIGAFSSAALAQKGWSDTAHLLPGPMAGKTRKVESTSKDGKTFYRAYVGGFASHAEAVKFCAALQAKSKPCFVK
jgi:septal ring-binding cell division protein DamX